MRTSFEAAGDIRGVDLLAAFVEFWRGKASGSVRFSRGGASAGFDLSSGEVAAVFSSEPRFTTASVLVRAGKLEAAALERLSAPEGSDAALAALAAGILTKREWRWGEKIRAIEILSDLLLWPEGKYLFDADARPAPGEFTLTIPRLLLELFLRSRDRNLIEHQLGPPDAPLLRASNFEEEFATFGLTADAESVVRLIGGRSSAAEISRMAPADEFAVLKLLAALTTLGLVHPAQDLSEVSPGVASETPVAPEPEFSPDALDMAVAAGEPPLQEAPETIEPPDLATEMHDIFPASPAPHPGEPVEAALEGEPAGESFDSDFPLREERALREESGRRGRGAPLVWLLGILLAAIAAILFVRSRSLPRQEAAGRPPAPIPATAPPSPAQALAPTVAPPAVTLPPSPAPTKGKMSVPTVQATVPPAARQRQAPTAGRNDAARREWVQRAERDRRRLAAEPVTHFAIQLELACEVPSLAEAWKHDQPAGSMWLLVTPHGGRDCFRVLWGRYRTREAAIQAKAGIPSFFVTPSNRPAVVAVR